MVGLAKLLIFGFIGLSAVYFTISIYSRSVRREKLEDSWAENNPGSADMDARAAYVEKGIAEYNVGIKRKLILLVYVVPIAAILAILIITNWS